MKIVVSWLRELCPATLSADELAELLTNKGAEVESVERPWDRLSGVIVSRVVEVRDHPNSDTLCIARVQTGSGELEVVVGVRNMAPGDLVPLAPAGATVPGLPEPLAAREIRGVVSNGMLCAPDELGVSGSHEGILILPDPLEPGWDVAEVYGLSDAVIDIEVTPNRPDFLSVLGVAREVSAATGTPLETMAADGYEVDEPADGVATVEIEDLERCQRYLARIVRDVAHGASPIAIQARLWASGMRPISAAVDATNYAMLELGQPLHAFDLSLLKGSGIVVRRAEAGETLVTLDDVERTFTNDDLLICDTERPVAVGGVIGGELAEVSDQTTDILLEAASFERGGVQRTRRRLDLSTEASMRFERGVDPEAPPAGAARACRLMTEWCGARVLRGTIEAGASPERRRITMRPSRASMLIGHPVSAAEAGEVFDRLGIGSEPVDGDTIRVEVPGYRVDLEREVDLIEEVVRIQGYEHVGSTLPAVRQAGGLTPSYAFRRRVRGSLRRAGLREVRQPPFVSDADLELTGDRHAIRVTNPLQADEGWLRTSLLPGLLAVAKRNASRQVRSVAVFEANTVFRLEGGLAVERPMAAIVMTGLADTGWTGGGRTFDTFDAKGVVEALMTDLGVEWFLGDPAPRPFHPGRSAIVIVGGEPAGAVGELHPKVAGASDLLGRVAVAELELERLMDLAGRPIEAGDVPRFPPVRRDLAFTVATDVAAGDVRTSLEDAAGELLGSVELFDVFEGDPLPEGTKSLAFSLELRASDRTLTDAEADAVVASVVQRLRRDFDAELRAG